MAGRKPVVNDKEILAVFRQSPHDVLTTSEVAQEFDFSTTGMRKRLDDLKSRGLLGGRKTPQVRLWWITEDGREYLDE